MNYEYYMRSGQSLHIIATISKFIARDLSLVVYALHNTSGGSDADCVSHFSGPDEWKCLFAVVRQLYQY